MYVIINLKILFLKIIYIIFGSGSFSPFVQNATSTCSVLTIMAISYERYVAICQPLKVDYLFKKKIEIIKISLFRHLLFV